MTNIRILFITVIAIQLSGCASLSQEASNLTVPTTKSSFVVPEISPLKSGTIEISGGHRGSKLLGLLPGTYTAEKENALGTYYLGPNPAIWEEVDNWAVNANLFVHRGGIWIPNDPQATPRIYTYPGASQPVRVPIEQIHKTGPVATRDTTQFVNDAVIRQLSLPSSSGTSVVASGIGAGIAGGLIGAFAEAGAKQPIFLSKSITDLEFIAKIRAAKNASLNNTLQK